MSNTVNKQIQQIIKSAREQADEAMRIFDREISNIQNKASRSIDLFGGTAVSQVADIAKDARRASDSLYATLQMLVRVVDDKCRILLSQNPDVDTVRKVENLIAWLNDESEISNNFKATLNSSNLGDVAAVRYVPSIESKMIQSYWHQKFLEMPGAQAILDQEAKAQKAAEQRERDARRMIADIRAEERNCTTLSGNSEVGTSVNSTEIEEQLRKKEASVTEKLEMQKKEMNDKQRKVDQEIRAVEAQINALRTERARLSIFKGKRKKEIDSEVLVLEQKIVQIRKAFEPHKQAYRTKMLPLEQELERLSSLWKLLTPKIGATISFGSDPLAKKKDLIEWKVVSCTDNQIWLISKDIIGYGTFKRPYFGSKNTDDYVTWLCNFEKKAFSTQERRVLTKSPMEYYKAPSYAFVYTIADAKKPPLNQYLSTSLSANLRSYIEKDASIGSDWDRTAMLNTSSSSWWLHSREMMSELTVNRVKKDDSGKWNAQTMRDVTNDEFGGGIRPAIILDRTKLKELI